MEKITLTERQLQTIEHLNYKKDITAQEIIAWATHKLTLPRRHNNRKTPEKRIPGRKYSKMYYQQIIDFYTAYGTKTK